MSDAMNTSDPYEPHRDASGGDPSGALEDSGFQASDANIEIHPDEISDSVALETAETRESVPSETLEEGSSGVNKELVVGPDLRADISSDPLYYKLREARAAARTIERANTAKKPDELAPNPHWKKIIEWSPAALEQSKDLEIAAWYTEALLREEGFGGLAKGFALMQDLVSTYGDKLYPAFDEEEGWLDSTLAPLGGLNGTGSAAGTLISPINCVLITNAKNGPNFATWQYTQSLNLSRAPNEKVRQERIKNGVPTMDALMVAAKASSPIFYEKLSEELDNAIASYQGLTTVLDEKFKQSSPPSSHIKMALSACRKALQSLGREQLAKTAVKAEGDSEGSIGGDEKSVSLTGENPLSLNSSNTQENRKNAIDSLRNLADFFKRTEPHSPIGYTLERAVRWSGMELPALLREFILDPHVQNEVGKTTGVPMEQPPQQAAAMPNPAAPYDYASGYNAPAPGAGGFDPYAAPAGGMSGGGYGGASSYGAAPGGYGAAPAYDPNAGMGGAGSLGGGMPPAGGFGGSGFGNNSF